MIQAIYPCSLFSIVKNYILEIVKHLDTIIQQFCIGGAAHHLLVPDDGGGGGNEQGAAILWGGGGNAGGSHLGLTPGQVTRISTDHQQRRNSH